MNKYLSSVPRRSVLMCCQVEVERVRVERRVEELTEEHLGERRREAFLGAWLTNWRESDILLTHFTATVVHPSSRGLQISRGGQGIHNTARVYTHTGVSQYRSQLDLQSLAPVQANSFQGILEVVLHLGRLQLESTESTLAAKLQ